MWIGVRRCGLAMYQRALMWCVGVKEAQGLTGMRWETFVDLIKDKFYPQMLESRKRYKIDQDQVGKRKQTEEAGDKFDDSVKGKAPKGEHICYSCERWAIPR